MAWVFAESPTTGTDRLVLLSIANHANETGYAWPSVATIAREANASERAVQRSLANLKDAGYITVLRNAAPDERIPKDRRPNLYRVLKQRGDAHGTPRGDAGGSDGVTLVTSRGDAGGTQTISEPSINHWAETPTAPGNTKKRPARKQDPLFDALVDVCKIDADNVTKDERGRVNNACKQLREVGATEHDVRERAKTWRKQFPDGHLTPQSLTKSWTTLAPRGVRLATCDRCGGAVGESHTQAACDLLAQLGEAS
jgi:hypothetical protein